MIRRRRWTLVRTSMPPMYSESTQADNLMVARSSGRTWTTTLTLALVSAVTRTASRLVPRQEVLLAPWIYHHVVSADLCLPVLPARHRRVVHERDVDRHQTQKVTSFDPEVNRPQSSSGIRYKVRLSPGLHQLLLEYPIWEVVGVGGLGHSVGICSDS